MNIVSLFDRLNIKRSLVLVPGFVLASGLMVASCGDQGPIALQPETQSIESDAGTSLVSTEATPVIVSYTCGNGLPSCTVPVGTPITLTLQYRDASFNARVIRTSVTANGNLVDQITQRIPFFRGARGIYTLDQSFTCNAPGGCVTTVFEYTAVVEDRTGNISQPATVRITVPGVSRSGAEPYTLETGESSITE